MQQVLRAISGYVFGSKIYDSTSHLKMSDVSPEVVAELVAEAKVV